MFRSQLVLSAILIIISTVFLSLYDHTKLQLSTYLAATLLFPVRAVTQCYEFLSAANTRITELEIAINKLKLENSELKNKILVDTTEFKTTNFELLKAHIIGRDPSNINSYLYVDKGKNHKIIPNQPVISINGLVGKIKFVAASYSVVETIENQGFALSAIDVNTGIHGIIKKKDELVFDFIRIDDEINIGDSICTSGMSEIFPEGILIGKVKKIEHAANLFFKPIYISPSVQINRLNYVYVIARIETTSTKELRKPFYKHQDKYKSTIPE